MKDFIQTVLGEVAVSDLGVILPHEHFNAAINKVFYKSPLYGDEKLQCQFELKNIGWIRQNPYSHRENMHFEGDDVDREIIREVELYKKAGGKTIVENTSIGLGRNLKLFKKVAQETGVNIIAGTGYYVHASQTADVISSSQETLSNFIKQELTDGCMEDRSVRCGYIGEIGCTWPLTDFERRSLKASADVESQLDCPVMIHPGRNSSAPEEILRVYMEAGGNPKRVVLGHLDRTIQDEGDLVEFADTGTFLEFDLFGIETSFFQQNVDTFMPSDGQRIMRIKHLIANGFEDRILISHDIHTRHRLEKFGGHGFSHIFNSVLPMMSRQGITKQQIEKITVINPADWLASKK